MMLFPDNDGYAALFIRLGYQLLDPPHIGAGGVYALYAQLRQPVKNLFSLSVRTDDDRIAWLDLLHAAYAAAAHRLQIPHHMGIVDDAAQHHAAAQFLGGLLRQSDGTFHAIAKSGALRLNDFHCTPPSS